MNRPSVFVCTEVSSPFSLFSLWVKSHEEVREVFERALHLRSVFKRAPRSSLGRSRGYRTVSGSDKVANLCVLGGVIFMSSPPSAHDGVLRICSGCIYFLNVCSCERSPPPLNSGGRNQEKRNGSLFYGSVIRNHAAISLPSRFLLLFLSHSFSTADKKLVSLNEFRFERNVTGKNGSSSIELIHM